MKEDYAEYTKCTRCESSLLLCDCNCPKCDDCACCCDDWGGHDKYYIALPSLSELIEACGGDFWSLTNKSDGWEVVNMNKCEKIIEIGKTPEEAVAKLWLKLSEE